jgi:carbamoyl-phosphate synthase small subunit
MHAALLLEDGRRFEGRAAGAAATRVGELVFNTGMTGYQELLTDPSYAEQIVVMTAPHIGNTGVNGEDPESERAQVSGFVARRFCAEPSSWRAQGALDPWLAGAGVPAMEGIDTRALVRHIRSRGAMRAILSTEGLPIEELERRLRAWPGMSGLALADKVCATGPRRLFDHAQPRARVALIDGGAKSSIGALLGASGCRVDLWPITSPAEAWAEESDFVLLSNGPGDPAALGPAIAGLRRLLGRLPLLGVCLGHQLLGLALGAETFKLRFGHRGSNHPVRDLLTGRVEITSQNHGFCVDSAGVERAGGRLTHLNLNDGTLEGFRHDDLQLMAVQFHPEAAPGPHDSRHLLVERYLAFAGF